MNQRWSAEFAGSVGVRGLVEIAPSQVLATKFCAWVGYLRSATDGSSGFRWSARPTVQVLLLYPTADLPQDEIQSPGTDRPDRSRSGGLTDSTQHRTSKNRPAGPAPLHPTVQPGLTRLDRDTSAYHPGTIPKRCHGSHESPRHWVAFHQLDVSWFCCSYRTNPAYPKLGLCPPASYTVIRR